MKPAMAAPALARQQEKLLAQLGSAPNLLTILRLGIIPFLVISILDGHFITALVLLVLAGISDGLDGLLARMLHQRTVLGQYLDPIADKLMLCSLFLVLTRVGMVPLRVTVLVFSRDFGILLIATLLFAAYGLRDFRPSLLGKANTVIQILTVTVVIVTGIWSGSWLGDLKRVLVDGTMVLTVGSAAHYAWLMSQRLRAMPTA
jgi:cardiolipin synthase (CMP-forming)